MTKTSLKLISLMALTPAVLAGSLDSPSPPTGASSAMYSLQSICDRLQSGAAGSQNVFTEPTSGPGATGCTFNDVMTKAPAPDNTTGAIPADVATGKKFWGLKNGGWGLQIGTAIPAAVPKTGQTTSYATGDDGALQKGAALPSPRFTDNSNGTVTDNLTGLIWLKNASCFGVQTWTNALSSANGLANGTCSLTDGSTAGQWRLPNRKELDSLIDLSKGNPPLPASHPFTGVQSDSYWSASSYALDTPGAWILDLIDGTVSAVPKTVFLYGWPVRGGQ
ncbi:MAG: hypothetical protein BWK78_08500 [Thiotrichaceae bacterium IS1]|nr:MAG: hypothetical protein BWK78_08500 [Thiotrichaceae bacterium IS1]